MSPGSRAASAGRWRSSRSSPADRPRSAAMRRAGGRGYAVDGELDGGDWPVAAPPGSSRFGGSRSRSAGSPDTTSPTPWPRLPQRAGWACRSSRSPTDSPTSGRAPSWSPGRLNLFRVGVADRHRRLRPQRGRGRGGPGRRRGHCRRCRRSRGAGHGDRRNRRRPTGRHAPRHRPDRGGSGPSASRSRRRSSTSVAGPARQWSGRCWPGSRQPGGSPADVPVYESETAALRGELANGDGRPRVIVLMCHEEREEVFALLEKLGGEADRRRQRAHDAGVRGSRSDRARTLTWRPRIVATHASGRASARRVGDQDAVVDRTSRAGPRRPAPLPRSAIELLADGGALAVGQGQAVLPVRPQVEDVADRRVDGVRARRRPPRLSPGSGSAPAGRRARRPRRLRERPARPRPARPASATTRGSSSRHRRRPARIGRAGCSTRR